MSLTSHNQFFGWVHSFKINRHHLFFTPDLTAERPFPVILNNPTILQVYQNWNSADTGLVATSLVLGLLISKSVADKTNFQSIIDRRFFFKRVVNLCVFTGIVCGMFNSANRLQGYVPNGLTKKRTQEVLKYDYTSQFVSQTPWKYLYSGRSRPSNE